MKTVDRWTTGLVLLIIVAMAIGAYRVDRVANNVIEAQHELVFAFKLQDGNTIIVYCDLNSTHTQYMCRTLGE